MEKLKGLLGIVVIFIISFLLSNNRKAISIRLVLTGFLLQIAIAFFVLKTTLGISIFKSIGDFIENVLGKSAKAGAEFVFGILIKEEVLEKALNHNSFIFFFKLLSTIILICVLVSMSYYLGIMQRVVAFAAKIFHKIMNISASEAISNVASAFVGQVEAQIMIKPYLSSMTKSELLASMSGSMACISGGVMAIYIGFGIPAEYLLVASLMAAPGALVISKIVYPETQTSSTKGKIRLKIAKESSSIIDSISRGCSDGLKISLNVTAMLIGFVALIEFLNIFFSWFGAYINFPELSLQYIFGKVFSLMAFLVGIPSKDIEFSGTLLGTKLVINEFMAYFDLKTHMTGLDPRTISILSIALCGFANLGSIGIQIGGIGQMIPERRSELAKLAFRALICGSLTSYLSACIVGLII